MVLLKNCYRVKANSLLESVIAVCIISVCLYIGIVIYSKAYTSKTSLKAYTTQNKINEAFVLIEAGQDSLLDGTEQRKNWKITQDDTDGLQKLTIKYSDSLQSYPEKSYYIAQ